MNQISQAFNGLTDWLKQYWFLIAGAATAISFVYGIYKSSQTSKAIQELTMTKANAETAITSQAEQYEQKIASLQTQLTSATQNNSQDALMEAQNLLQSQKATFEGERQNLLGQIQSLQQALQLAKTQTQTVTQVK